MRIRRADQYEWTKLCYAATVVLMCSACIAPVRRTTTTPFAGRHYHDVSLDQLLEHPQWFDGDWVRVEGVAHFEYEGTALGEYESLGREQNGPRRAVWLSLGWPLPSAAHGLSGSRVIVEARFNASGRGHAGAFPSELTDVRAIWRPGRENDAYVTNYETRTDALEQLEFKTAWVWLAVRVAGRLEAGDGSTAAICLPRAGERVRVTRRSRLYIVGVRTTGEARRMEAPLKPSGGDETRLWIAAGTLVRVEEIVSNDPGYVWARVSPVQTQ